MPSETPDPVQETLKLFAQWMKRAQDAGVALRPPPPLPTTCCGRGCNGCVWEGFYQAAQYWQEDAQQALASRGTTNPLGQ